MKSHLFNIHDIVLIMTMNECILLAVLQSLILTQSRLSHRLLTAFFLLIFLNTAGNLILWNEALQDLELRHRSLLPLALAVSFLLKGPALYFYLRSICEPAFRLGYRHLLHLLPTLLAAVVILAFDIDAGDLPGNDDPLKSTVALWLWTGFKLLPVIYATVCAYTVRHVSATLMNHYSDPGEMGAGWANILVVGYLVHWAWSLLTHLIGGDVPLPLSDAFGIVDNYLSFIMINLLFVYSLFYARRLVAATAPGRGAGRAPHTPEHPNGEDTPREVRAERPQQHRDEGRRAAEHEVSAAAIDKVYSGIRDEKLFLEQNINIEQFARRVGLSSRDASQGINAHFNANFFEFINKYRVEEAQRLLASEQYRDATILDILYRSGFNSKSAFQRFFKRIAGMSPSEYRKAHLNSPPP